MVTYMRSVFTLLFQISPELGDSAGCDPEDLAVRTTNHAFQSMSLKTGELMSFAQYKVWYVSDDAGASMAAQGTAQTEDSDSESGYGDMSEGGSEDELDIFQVQSLLGLHESNSTDVTSAFFMFADEFGRLSEPVYMAIFRFLISFLNQFKEMRIQTPGASLRVSRKEYLRFMKLPSLGF